MSEPNPESTPIVTVCQSFLESDQHQYFRTFNLLFAAENIVKDLERRETDAMGFSRIYMLSSWLSFMLSASADHLIMCLAFDSYHFLDILAQKTDLLKATVIWLDHMIFIVHVLEFDFISGT